MRVASNDAQVTTRQCKRLGDKLPEPPRADKQYAISGPDLYLLLDLQGRGEWFGEDSHLIWHRASADKRQ